MKEYTNLEYYKENFNNLDKDSKKEILRYLTKYYNEEINFNEDLVDNMFDYTLRYRFIHTIQEYKIKLTHLKNEWRLI